MQTDATTPNSVAQTMLGVVASVVCKRMQQLPTVLRKQCWELLRPWCANGRNNSQQCCANNDGSCCVRGVQTDATTPNKFGTCSASWEEYNP